MSIEQRPAIVDSRKRYGDWEGDLVIGAGQQQACVTLNERKSRYSLIAHVPFKIAQAVSDTMISLLTPFAACVHTLTTDNGKEFAQHERIAKKLDADFFFAYLVAIIDFSCRRGVQNSGSSGNRVGEFGHFSVLSSAFLATGTLDE